MSAQSKLLNQLLLIGAVIQLLFYSPISAQIPVGFVPSFNSVNSKDRSDKSRVGGSTFFELLRLGNYTASGVSFDYAEEKWLGAIQEKDQDYAYVSLLKISLGLGHSEYSFKHGDISRGLYLGANVSMNYVEEPSNPGDFPIYGLGGWIDVALNDDFAFKINHDVMKSLNEDKKYYLSKASFILWKWFSINISILRDENSKFNFFTVCPGIFIRYYPD